MKTSRTAVVTSIVAMLIALCASVLLYGAWRRGAGSFRPVPEPAVTVTPLEVGGTPPMPEPVVRHEVPEIEVTEIASNLEVIWALRFSSDGRLFVTERPGRILVMKPGSRELTPYARLSTTAGGESGLMGLALHPGFPREPWVYVMYTARKEGGAVNRVSRLVDKGDSGTGEQVLIDDIPAALNHDGGALEFGPDGMLYIGTGDAQTPALAQDLGQLNGKVLRITPDGRTPPDNPFPGSPIWAYGFRNVSGLAFHPVTRELWAASHGPSATSPGKAKFMDSVYQVQKGRNHGWPSHLGVSADPSIVSPTIFFADRYVPPGGLAFYSGPPSPLTGSLFMTALRSQEMHRYVVGDDGSIVRFEQWWPNRFGRLRALTIGDDGAIYVGTSNRDGRSTGDYPGSDVIYRLRLTTAAQTEPSGH